VVTHGLTLGKYAPLHRGHQHVIETALGETDAVTAVIYDCPETTPVPLPVRACWLRTLYPALRVIEAWDGPTVVGDTPEIRALHEDYLLNRLGLRDAGVTHFYSSEFYGDHVSAAFGAVDRQVDPARTAFPVSGTAVRADPYRHREFLDPVVYRDLIMHVVFLGAPSTGKTTLAERMAREFDTVWMPEYGREYWEAHQSERRLTPEQLVEIAEGHREREDAQLYRANRYLFTDTDARTTRQFALYYHGSALPRLNHLADDCAARYDVTFLCEADIPYDDTPDRSGDVARQTFQKRIVADLLTRKTPFFRLRGNLESRVARVKRILAAYQKYGNLTDAFYP
jgi:HTH-type transcriptional regulator, transcriptional repressor of NAD biosynthesis genes